MKILICCTFLLVNYCLAFNRNSTLKQIHVVFRHGERSPTETYPNDPHKNYTWSGGFGHLTNRGKFQIYSLGETVKQRYTNFLPEYYYPDENKIFSSYADRCLMTAQVFAAALYPPHNHEIWNPNLLWQPIPVHYLPRNKDNFIAMKQTCATYDAIFKNIPNTPKMKKIDDENRGLYKFLTNKTGMVVDNIGTIETLYNTLQIEQVHNLTLPTWVNETLLVKMKQLGAQNLAIYSDTEQMKRMKGGVLLKKVIDTMKNVTKNIDEPSVLLYSGHDLSLVHVLRTLNLIDTIKPEFGASLTFELEDLDYSGNYVVKILYSNSWDEVPKQMDIPNCQTKCTLDAFETLMKNVLPANWDEECQM